MKTSAGSSTSLPTTRTEWLLAGALLVVGIGLRWWIAGWAAVEHFDEGVYSSNLYFNEPPYCYPMQHMYAPPLLPSLIEGGMIAGLPPNLAAIVPGLLAGCLTLVIVWRLARRWFGPAAGLASLALAALSDFHIAYSSTALTDVLLTLFVLLAVGAAARALASAVQNSAETPEVAPVSLPTKASPLQRDKRAAGKSPLTKTSAAAPRGSNLVDKWAVIAGLATAAAWWTKYSGWLPLAIAIAGTGLLLVVSRSARSHWRRLCFVLVLIVAVAAIAWSPMPLGLGEVGGYAAVSANHAKYVVGPAGWVGAALRQVANQSAMEGVLSWLSLPVALLAAWTLSLGESTSAAATKNSITPLIVLGGMVVLAAAAVVESTFVVLLVLSFIAVALHSLHLLRRSSERRLDESTVGFCLLAAWLLGLLVATPNYWPYPRLVMPLLAGLWLSAGFALSLFTHPASQGAGQPIEAPIGRWRLLTAIAVGLMIAAPIVHFGRTPIESIRGSLSLDRSGMSRAAYEIGTRITSDLKQNQEEPFCLIFVRAEPALVFQLRAAGFPVVRPVTAPPAAPITIDGRRIPTYFVFGPHSNRDSQFIAHWPSRKASFAELGSQTIEIQPSKVVWLDSNDPRREKLEPETITLVRRK